MQTSHPEGSNLRCTHSARRRAPGVAAMPPPTHTHNTAPAQALHVAVIARQHAAIAALLDGGVPPDVKNERMWSPLDDAVALGDAEAAQMLYRCAAAKRGGGGVAAAVARGSACGCCAACRAPAAPHPSPSCSPPLSSHRTRRSRLLAAAKVAKRQKKEALAAVMTTGLPDFRMQASQGGVVPTTVGGRSAHAARRAGSDQRRLTTAGVHRVLGMPSRTA